MTETTEITGTHEGKYQKAVIDPQIVSAPSTNVEVSEARTIKVTDQTDTINIRIIPRPSIQGEFQKKTG